MSKIKSKVKEKTISNILMRLLLMFGVLAATFKLLIDLDIKLLNLFIDFDGMYDLTISAFGAAFSVWMADLIWQRQKKKAEILEEKNSSIKERNINAETKKKTYTFWENKKFNYKTLWWVILILLCIMYVILRVTGKIPANKTIDNVVIPAGVILAIFPLISEVSFLGLSFKKEINDLKADVDKQFFDIRRDLSVSMNAFQNVNPIINNNYGELPSLKEVKNEIEKYNKTINGVDLSEGKDLEYLYNIDNDILFMFKVRYIIEKKINNIYTKVTYGEYYKYDSKIANINNIGLQTKIYILFNKKGGLVDLERYNIYEKNLEEKILEIVSICNRAIHGDSVDIKYVDFVKLKITNIFSNFDKILK